MPFAAYRDAEAVRVLTLHEAVEDCCASGFDKDTLSNVVVAARRGGES